MRDGRLQSWPQWPVNPPLDLKSQHNWSSRIRRRIFIGWEVEEIYFAKSRMHLTKGKRRLFCTRFERQAELSIDTSEYPSIKLLNLSAPISRTASYAASQKCKWIKCLNAACSSRAIVRLNWIYSIQSRRERVRLQNRNANNANRVLPPFCTYQPRKLKSIDSPGRRCSQIVSCPLIHVCHSSNW